MDQTAVRDQEIEIAKIKIGKRFRREAGNLMSLMTSINTVGLLHPIVIDEKNNLVAGFRRIAAFKALKQKTIPYRRVNIESLIKGEFAENVERKDFLPSELNAIIRAVADTRIGHRPKRLDESTTLPKGKTRKLVAEISGISPDTVKKVKYVFDHGTKMEKDKVDRTGNVDGVYREVKMRKVQSELKPVPIPRGKYNLIVDDPSWPHENKVTGGSLSSGNAQKYAVETIDKIINKIPKEYIDDDAIMFLWTLPTMHRESLQVVEGRGFTVIRTKLYLIKKKIKQGYNYRNQVEECLVCIRGKVRAFHMVNQSTAVFADSDSHSQKPNIMFDIFEESAQRGLAGKQLQRLEINARSLRKGWTCVGNQIGCKRCNQYHVDLQQASQACKCKCHKKLIK